MDESTTTDAGETSDQETSAEVVNFAIAPVLALGIFLAILGNLLVLVSWARDRRLRTVNNCYVVHLAVADLLIGSVSMPFYAYYTLSGLDWPFGRIFCKIYLTVDYTVCLQSALLVVLISWDRLALLRQGLQYTQRETSRRAHLRVCAAWLFSFLFYAPTIALWDVWSGATILGDRECDVEFANHVAYMLASTAMEFFLVLVLLIVINSLVFVQIRKRKRAVVAMKSPGTVADVGEEEKGKGFKEVQGKFKRITTISGLLSGLKTAGKVGDGGKNTPWELETTQTSSHSDHKKNSTHMTTPPRVFLGPEETPEVSLRADDNLKLEDVDETATKNTTNANTTKALVHLNITKPTENHQQLLVEGDCRTDVEKPSSDRCTGVDGSTPHENPTAVKTKAKRQRPRGEGRVGWTLGTLVGAFLLLWAPYSVCSVLEAACACLPEAVYEYTAWTLWFKAAVNPFLYAFGSTLFRANFRQLLTFSSCRK